MVQFRHPITRGHEMTYAMREARVGSKWTPGYRPTREIAAAIRKDLKQAQRDGMIPADVKISVRSSTFAGGRAVDVVLGGWAQDRVWDASDDYRMTEEANRVQRRVNSIREAYNRDASDAMVDYWDVTYYGGTRWEYPVA